MKLPQKALSDLRKVLRKDIGEKGLGEFDDELLNDLGITFLNLTAIVLKRKIRLKKHVKI